MKNPFQSRKFLIAFIVIVIGVIAAFAPAEVIAKVDRYIEPLAVVIVSVVLGITAEDSVKWWATRPKTNEDALRVIFEELMAHFFGGQTPVPPASGTTTIKSPSVDEAGKFG